MPRRIKVFLLNQFIFWIIFCLANDQAFPQTEEGKKLYAVNCSVCHTLGEGKLLGPDLKGILGKRNRDWLIRFIRSSQAMISSGNAEAIAVFEAYDKVIMPDQTLTDYEIDLILDYIADPGSYYGIVTDFEPESEPLLNLTNSEETPDLEDVGNGRKLFNGMIALINGGPSCISCHHMNDGKDDPAVKPAPDLIHPDYSIDEQMIMELGTSPGHHSMQEAYLDQPITEEEAALLAAYLRYAGRGVSDQQKRDQPGPDFLKED